MRHSLALLAGTALLALLAFAGCSSEDYAQVEEVVEQIEPDLVAVAQIEPMDGSGVSGVLTFQEVGDYVRVSGTVAGLSEGKHGFHIHEGTSCEDYGGHYAPEGSMHGSPDQAERHVGDLGNLVAGADSVANFERVDPVIALSGSRSVLGHALIVHQNDDDYVSQPSGNGGPVIGCGLIELETAQASAMEN